MCQTTIIYVLNLDIPYEISTLRNFGIVRVAPNIVIIVGGHNELGPNSWLWQGQLTNEGLLIKWTRKCNVQSLRMFNSGHPFSFQLGDSLYFIGLDRNVLLQPEGTREKMNQPRSYPYCDRYNLKDGEYTIDVHSVPSTFSFGPNIVLKDNQETFVLITDGPSREWTFLFTADMGFDDALKAIGSTAISVDHLFSSFYKPYYLIKIL